MFKPEDFHLSVHPYWSAPLECNRLAAEQANAKLELLKKDIAPILNVLGGTFLLHTDNEELVGAVLKLKEFIGDK